MFLQAPSTQHRPGKRKAPGTRTEDDTTKQKKSYEEHRKPRTFQESWLEEYPFLEHHAEEKIMICTFCVANPNLADRSVLAE